MLLTAEEYIKSSYPSSVFLIVAYSHEENEEYLIGFIVQQL